MHGKYKLRLERDAKFHVYLHSQRSRRTKGHMIIIIIDDPFFYNLMSYLFLEGPISEDQ
jgi:hypothetical protein